MYERLIQKLINRKVSAIAGTLTPTGGTTSCPIYLGNFSWTYDGSTSTICVFSEGTCTSEWYWDTPVNVTKFNILSYYYYLDSCITVIWGLVAGSWVQLWSGVWNPSNATWDSKIITCNNCTGIKISQTHVQQTLKTAIAEVSIDYEEIEGHANIISVTMPDSFIPGVAFLITIQVRNDGGDDHLFVRLTDTDTGTVLKDYTSPAIVPSGTIWSHTMNVTLTQTTDFHGRIDAGHIE